MVGQGPARLEELAAPVRESGGTTEAFPVDVTDSTAIEAVVPVTAGSPGPPDLLVNAAVVLQLGQAEALTDEDWAATFAVNATGLFSVSRANVN